MLTIAILISLAQGTSTDCPNLIYFAEALGMQTAQPNLWDTLQSDCCTAAGVTCAAQRVTGIRWQGMSLNEMKSKNETTIQRKTFFCENDKYMYYIH